MCCEIPYKGSFTAFFLFSFGTFVVYRQGSGAGMGTDCGAYLVYHYFFYINVFFKMAVYIHGILFTVAMAYHYNIIPLGRYIGYCFTDKI